MAAERILVIRHGFRQDWEPIEPQEALYGPHIKGPSPLPAFPETKRGNDPYLSNLGLRQATEMASFIAPKLLDENGKIPSNVLVLTSPYIRCIQTSLSIHRKLFELGVPHSELPRLTIEHRLREWYLPTDKEAAEPLNNRKDIEKFVPGSSGLVVPETWPSITPGENLQRTKEELLDSLKKLAVDLSANDKYRSKTIICVTHAASTVSLIRGFDIENEPAEGKPWGDNIKDEDSSKMDPDYRVTDYTVAIDGGYRVHCGVCSTNLLTREEPKAAWKHTYVVDYLSSGNTKDWQFRS